jgi:uncharacterized peroxidase-related enzyme
LVKDEAFVTQLGRDYTRAALKSEDRAMLDYADKLTRTPGEMTRADVDRLREVGFSDRAILDIAQIVSYFAYANRIADGLGISLEDYWREGNPDAH